VGHSRSEQSPPVQPCEQEQLPQSISQRGEEEERRGGWREDTERFQFQCHRGHVLSTVGSQGKSSLCLS
jgi:hypothetical protein